MVRQINRSVVGVVVGSVLAMLVCAAPANAMSPWWHLGSSALPTYLQPGQAKDEVQEVTVSATEGEFGLLDSVASQKEEFFNKNGEPEFAFFNFKAEATVVQEGLEKIYGAGNVTVGGGPGDEEGTKSYRITWHDRHVGPMLTGGLLDSLGCTGATGVNCKEQSTVKEVAKGRSDGFIVVTAVNLGDANADPQTQPVTITDKLPPGLKAVDIEGVANLEGIDGQSSGLECSLGSLSCTYTGARALKVVPPYGQIVVTIAVDLQAGAKSGEVNGASVTGGGAPEASVKRPVLVSFAPTPFGVSTYEMRPEEEGGGVDTQAGSHPFQLTTTLSLNETLNQNSNAKPVAMTKDLHFKLPAGLIGNPTPFSQCTLANFLGPQGLCSAQTVVGAAKVAVDIPDVELAGEPTTFFSPLYNLEPSVGEPARFGFVPSAGVPVILDTAVRTGGDYGVTVNVDNITQVTEFISSEVTFWGVPGDPRHDNARNWGCLYAARRLFGVVNTTCNPFEAHHPPPLLSLPTSCTGALQTSVEADSWKQQGSFQSFPNTDQMPALDGCNRLPFSPSISVAPDGQAGSTPTGLTVGVHVPQDLVLNPTGLAESNVKDTTVALPAGVALNPAAADGLQACSEEQIALSVDGAASCPESAKVAT